MHANSLKHALPCFRSRGGARYAPGRDRKKALLLSSFGNSRVGHLNVCGYRLELYLVRVKKTSAATFAMGRRMLELAVTAAMVALPAVDAGACRPKWPLNLQVPPSKGEQHQITSKAFSLALVVLEATPQFASTFAFHLRGVDLKRYARLPGPLACNLCAVKVSENKEIASNNGAWKGA
jgi:hypothetical protein